MYCPSYIFSNVYLFSSLKPSSILLIAHSHNLFVCHKSTPRIKKEILQKPKQLGSLALANFLLYYWAANIRTILHNALKSGISSDGTFGYR